MKNVRIIGTAALLLLAGCTGAEVTEPTSPTPVEETGGAVVACAAFFDGGDRSYENKIVRMLTDLPEQPRQFDFRTRADAYTEVSMIAETAPAEIGEPMQTVADALKPFHEAVQTETYSVNYETPDLAIPLTDLMEACAAAGYTVSQ